MSRNDYLHPIELPGVTIPCNLFLAPLAGFTDSAFRSICIEGGACFTFTEMVSAEGLIRNNKKTTDLLERATGEKLYGIQLFTSDPETAEAAAAACRDRLPALIDLNCGCPVPKVVKNGAGAGLMRDPERLYGVIRALKRGAGEIPVSVKIRTGWDPESINYLEAAEAAESAGAAMICLHARTRKQGYAGTAAWEHIKTLKDSISVPVIGSGDLFSPEDVRFMFETTGCDAVMLARGAIGNPFIFERTKVYLQTGILPAEVPVRDRIETALRHYYILMEKSGEKRASKEIKKHFAAYTKGLPRSGELRNRLMHGGSGEIFEKILKNYLEENNISM